MNDLVAFHAWASAWEAEMARRGHLRARLTPWPLLEAMSYSWTSDVDGSITLGWEQPEAAWSDAHEAFLRVDHLRPRAVMPSLALAELLAEHGAPS